MNCCDRYRKSGLSRLQGRAEGTGKGLARAGGKPSPWRCPWTYTQSETTPSLGYQAFTEEHLLQNTGLGNPKEVWIPEWELGRATLLEQGLSLGTVGSRELGSWQFSAFPRYWGAGGGWVMEESQLSCRPT